MKYKLTQNTKALGFTILYQIQAEEYFSDVKKGDLGGWIEKKSNLSQFGSSWVYDNAIVYGNAKILGDAIVCNNAIVCGNTKFTDNTIVYDNVRVHGDTQMCGDAPIFIPPRRIITEHERNEIQINTKQ